MNSYLPDLEVARLAPAAICNVCSRVVWLRQAIERGEFNPEVAAKLERYVAAIPFEKELLSSRMDQVDKAIKKLGSL